VFVRPLSMDEGRKLQRITRTAQDPVRLRWAIVVMMSGQGQTVRDITSLLQVSEDYVRDVIHAFNERGFGALNPKWSGGRPKKIGEQLRSWICTIARTSPADWGITGFSTWSLTTLRDHLLAEGIVAELSRETLRRILRDGGISWQTTTTWKASTDPDFIAKMRRILDLYDHPPEGRPQPAGLNGVMHMLAALDLATGRLFYRIRARKRSMEFLDLLKALRAAGLARSCTWSATTSPRTATPGSGPGAPPTTSSWCSPTYGSWLNWIEAEFAAVRYVARADPVQGC